MINKSHETHEEIALINTQINECNEAINKYKQEVEAQNLKSLLVNVDIMNGVLLGNKIIYNSFRMNKFFETDNFKTKTKKFVNLFMAVFYGGVLYNVFRLGMPAVGTVVICAEHGIKRNSIKNKINKLEKLKLSLLNELDVINKTFKATVKTNIPEVKITKMYVNEKISYLNSKFIYYKAKQEHNEQCIKQTAESKGLKEVENIALAFEECEEAIQFEKS